LDGYANQLPANQLQRILNAKTKELDRLRNQGRIDKYNSSDLSEYIVHEDCRTKACKKAMEQKLNTYYSGLMIDRLSQADKLFGQELMGYMSKKYNIKHEEFGTVVKYSPNTKVQTFS